MKQGKMLLKKIFRLCLTLSFIILNFQLGFSQLDDGTKGTNSYFQLLKKNIAAENSLVFDSSVVGGPNTITLQVHIINDSTGYTLFSLQDFMIGLAEVNFYFAPVGLNFKVGVIDTVKEYPFSFVTSRIDNVELLRKYAKSKTINLFLVDSITIDSGRYYGFTHFPSDTAHNTIYLRKDYNGAKPLITQLGHFFGLLSTFENGAGQEFVNGINCSTAGDLICDTYADGGMLGQVDIFCQYTGKIKDPSGKYYTPSVGNFMTNGPFDCKCMFTNNQLRRMYFYYKHYRSYLR
jgi:hypothetical protein